MIVLAAIFVKYRERYEYRPSALTSCPDHIIKYYYGSTDESYAKARILNMK